MCIRDRGGRIKKTFAIKEVTERKFHLGASVGIASSKINTPNGVFQDFNSENNNELGFDINFVGKLKLVKSLSIRSGLNFKHRSRSTSYQEVIPDFYINGGESINYESNITINQLNLPVEFMLNLTKGKLSPYIFSGFSFGVSTKNSSFAEVESFANIGNALAFIKKKDSTLLNDPNHYELSWIGGVGLNFLVNDNSSIFLELKYMTSKNEVAKDSKFYISQKAIIFALGFYL